MYQIFLLLPHSDLRQNKKKKMKVRKMESLALEVAKQRVVRRTMKVKEVG